MTADLVHQLLVEADDVFQGLEMALFDLNGAPPPAVQAVALDLRRFVDAAKRQLGRADLPAAARRKPTITTAA